MISHRLLPLFLLTTSACKGTGIQGVDDIMRALLPTVRLDKAPLTRIGWDGVGLDLHVAVDNPNPVRVTVTSFNWHVDIGDQEILSGTQPQGMEIGAQASSAVVVPVDFAFTKAAALLPDLRERTEIPLHMGGTIDLRTPFGPVSVPIDLSTSVPMLHVPRVAVQSVRVEPPSLLSPRLEAAVVLDLSHRFASTTAFRDLAFTVTLSDRPLASGRVEDLATVSPDQPTTVEVPFTLDLLQAGATVIQTLTEGQRARVGFDATASVVTPWGDLPLSIDETTLVPLIQGSVGD